MPSLWEDNGVLLERDGVLIEGTEDACCTCALEYGCICGQCINSLAPAWMRVTFAGVVAKAPEECAACDDWNRAGGHKVPQWDIDCCYWLGDHDGSEYPMVPTLPCNGKVEIYAAGRGFECWTHENGFNAAEFANNYANYQTPCIDGATLALITASNADCDWSSATCEVVAWQ